MFIFNPSYGWLLKGRFPFFVFYGDCNKKSVTLENFLSQDRSGKYHKAKKPKQICNFKSQYLTDGNSKPCSTNHLLIAPI